MLTPQAIKDQEFQVKFRGFDAIEVKAYLELLAEDFFELTEQNRLQAEQIENLMVEQETIQAEKEELVKQLEEARDKKQGDASELLQELEKREQEVEELRERTEQLGVTITMLEGDNLTVKEEAEQLRKALEDGEGNSARSQLELDQLRSRLTILEEQNKELKQEGVDFKTTILAAQKFADNLRKTSEEEAAQIVAEAHAEVAKYRQQCEAELSRLPREIERLKAKKGQVREELRTVLQAYLESLDLFPDHLEEEGDEADEDLSDLFQSVHIPDGESFDPDEIDTIEVEDT